METEKDSHLFLRTEITTSSSKYTAFQALTPHIHTSFVKHQNQRFGHYPISVTETLQNGTSQTSEETTLGTGILGRKLQNSITMPFEDRLRISNWIPPPHQHILLGITRKHHDLLEDEYHSLDKLIGESLASPGKETPESSAAFHKFVAKSKETLQQEEEKRKRLNSFH